MSGLFKLPNSMFSKKLKVSEYRILAALYSCQSKYKSGNKRYVVVTLKRLGEICGILDAAKISRHISGLQSKGFIADIRRTKQQDGRPGTYAYLIDEDIFNDGFFFVQRNIFKYCLTASQMRMYLFICKCVLSDTRKCWNSYVDIANALGISRNDVMDTMKEIVKMKIVRKTKVKKQDGSYADNHYSIIYIPDFKLKLHKKKNRRKKCLNTRQSVQATVNILFVMGKILDLFFCISSIHRKNKFVNSSSHKILAFLRKYQRFLPRGSPKTAICL